MTPRLPWTKEQIDLGLRAIRTVLSATGAFYEAERALFDAAAFGLGAPAAGPEAPEPIAPAEVARALPEVTARRRLSEVLLIVGAAASGEAFFTAEGFDEALGIDREWLAEARREAVGWIDHMRLEAGRRIPHAALAANGMRDAAHDGRWKFFRLIERQPADPELSWRHKELGLLPRGSLGREYWTYMTDRGFLLPGERGSFGLHLSYYDFMRVLCGYSIDTAGEAETAAFAAGVRRREDPFAAVFAVLLTLRLSEALGQPAGSPASAVDIEPERLVRGWKRGLGTSADLGERWDYWSVVALPVEELRRRYGMGEPCSVEYDF